MKDCNLFKFLINDLLLNPLLLFLELYLFKLLGWRKVEVIDNISDIRNSCGRILTSIRALILLAVDSGRLLIGLSKGLIE